MEYLNTIMGNLNAGFFIHHFFVFLVNLLSYFYIFLKFYKVLCYSKLTFEWLPMINPYNWPFSVFQVLTMPYFNRWTQILPSIKLEKSSFEISSIIALEALNTASYFCIRVITALVEFLDASEITADISQDF